MLTPTQHHPTPFSVASGYSCDEGSAFSQSSPQVPTVARGVHFQQFIGLTGEAAHRPTAVSLSSALWLRSQPLMALVAPARAEQMC